tara:strand:+ start:371 stop:619 length:249 start_codon:yes stop_codon:yes gene_type:complete
MPNSNIDLHPRIFPKKSVLDNNKIFKNKNIKLIKIYSHKFELAHILLTLKSIIKNTIEHTINDKNNTPNIIYKNEMKKQPKL